MGGESWHSINSAIKVLGLTFKAQFSLVRVKGFSKELEMRNVLRPPPCSTSLS